MKIQNLTISNLRCLREFELHLGGESVFLIGENGSGKSTVLDGLARSLGQGMRLTRTDFADVQKPIEIEVTLTDLTPEQQGFFADEIDFGQPNSLRMGVRAVWDADLETVESVHGFPRRDWKKTNPEQRAALPVEWLSESRDVGSMLQMGGRRNLISRLLDDRPIERTVEEATKGISEARQKLGNDASIKELLDGAFDVLSTLVPTSMGDVFSIESRDTTARELLGALDLLLSHYGDPVPLQRQSSGLGQLAAFAFAIQLVEGEQGTVLLIDEPEISLHPQAQRALARVYCAGRRSAVEVFLKQ